MTHEERMLAAIIANIGVAGTLAAVAESCRSRADAISADTYGPNNKVLGWNDIARAIDKAKQICVTTGL